MTEAEKTHSYKKETALTKPRVVIIGGGFGGLYAARALAGAPVSVTLIDKRNYHLFRPMLYQAATGLLSADEISGRNDGRVTWEEYERRYSPRARYLTGTSTVDYALFEHAVFSNT